MTIEQINSLSREQLLAEEVNAGVAQWGEAERAGLVKMKSQSSDAELRAAIAQRVGANAWKVKGARIVKKAARSCIEQGVS